MGTNKKKKLETASIYIGIVAGVLTIGSMAYAQYKKSQEKKQAKALNGAYLNEQFLLPVPDDHYYPYENVNTDYSQMVSQTSGMNGVDTDPVISF